MSEEELEKFCPNCKYKYISNLHRDLLRTRGDDGFAHPNCGGHFWQHKGLFIDHWECDHCHKTIKDIQWFNWAKK